MSTLLVLARNRTHAKCTSTRRRHEAKYTNSKRQAFYIQDASALCTVQSASSEQLPQNTARDVAQADVVHGRSPRAFRIRFPKLLTESVLARPIATPGLQEGQLLKIRGSCTSSAYFVSSASTAITFRCCGIHFSFQKTLGSERGKSDPAAPRRVVRLLGALFAEHRSFTE